MTMTQISLDCPYDGCLTERAAFTCHSCVPLKRSQASEWVVFMQCAVCGNGVVGRFSGANVPHWINGAGDGAGSKILDIWPKRTVSAAPEYVPDNVKAFYLQGMDNFRRKNWDAAGAMFRKALDTSLRRLNPSG